MISNLWHIILESNTFNFIIFIAIFVLVFKKINIKGILNNLQSTIEEDVKKSNTAKEEAQNLLKKAQKRIENVDIDTQNIIKKANKDAEFVAEKIISSADSQIQIIDKNAQKAIENDIQKAKKSLSDITVKEAIKLTEDNLKNQLKSNPDIQNQFIDEALTKLEEINL